MKERDLEKIAQNLGGIFSLQQLRLYEADFLKSNLTRRGRDGYIKRISKGRYILTETIINENTLYLASNLIYQPSYISMETSLRHYDLIPEGVYLTTACSSQKTQKLSGDIGDFYYYHLKPALMRGYSLLNSADTKSDILIATVEKTICDFFYLKPHLTENDFAELRIDNFHLRELTTPAKLQLCADSFKVKRLSKIIQLFISFSQKNA
ncbi:hypothetical protein AGMMS50249_3810 [candidate division SR1 bacterium]|nr:hypothetical protein AGMMS50249_3810 [candidate division SR1 bacterium]